jgi:hypothetical protein
MITYEMIPDDVWMEIFKTLAQGRDLAKSFPVTQVCIRWKSLFPDSLGEAVISRWESVQGISSLRVLRSLKINTNINISNVLSLEIFQKAFTNLNTLVISSNITAPDVTDKHWMQLTNLKTLHLSRNIPTGSEFLLNGVKIMCLINLKSLKLTLDNENLIFNSLKLLVHLEEFSFPYHPNRSRRHFERIFGQDLELLEHLPVLKSIELPNHGFLHKRTIQAHYPQIQFRWEMLNYEVGFYIGEFSDENLRHGYGIMICNNGNRYEGKLEKGMFEGKGSILYPNGNRFVGMFKNGYREGKGCIYYPNGSLRFDGEFRKGFMEGKGVRICEDGSRYEGTLYRDQFVGDGVIYYSNGNLWEGNFKNGIRSGEGCIWYSNGDILQGEFKNGLIDGQATIYYSNGDSSVGEYKNGQFCGKIGISYPNRNSGKDTYYY